MLLTLHIVIAVVGLVAATGSLARPGNMIIRGSWGLTVLTLLTGAGLAFIDPSKLGHVCASGFTYLVGAGSLTAMAGVRLRRATARS